MKTVIFLCIIISVSSDAADFHLPEARKAIARAFIADCVKESGAKIEILAEARKGKFANDEGLKKFTLCFFNKAGILTPDAELKVDVALAMLPPGVDKVNVGKVLNACKSKKGNSQAEIALEIFKCYYLNTKQRIIYD